MPTVGESGLERVRSTYLVSQDGKRELPAKKQQHQRPQQLTGSIRPFPHECSLLPPSHSPVGNYVVFVDEFAAAVGIPDVGHCFFHKGSDLAPNRSDRSLGAFPEFPEGGGLFSCANGILLLVNALLTFESLRGLRHDHR